MNDHLSSAILTRLVDGELVGEEFAGVNRHLAECPLCTSNALTESLLKSATGKAGRRHLPPADLQGRLANLLKHERSLPPVPADQVPSKRNFAGYGWMAAAATLVICASLFGALRSNQQKAVGSSQVADLVTEVCDQHIATLAANAPPEVISSDRHTVKPWFQGRLPFSFNLPQNLPADTTLDGANMTYLHGQPTAQLLYSVGKHHVSVFLRQRTGPGASRALQTGHSGFTVVSFQTNDIEAVGVSDVDPARLADLLDRVKQAQSGMQGPSQ